MFKLPFGGSRKKKPPQPDTKCDNKTVDLNVKPVISQKQNVTRSNSAMDSKTNDQFSAIQRTFEDDSKQREVALAKENEMQRLRLKITYLEQENKELQQNNTNMKETLQINKQLLNGILGGTLTNQEDILDSLQEESDTLISEM